MSTSFRSDRAQTTLMLLVVQVCPIAFVLGAIAPKSANAALLCFPHGALHKYCW